MRTLALVSIDWRVIAREEWNLYTPAEGRMLDPEYALVVAGYAYRGAERVGMVYGPVCCHREVEDYIDAVLSPAMNEQLDEAVGPQAWRAESAGRGRKL